MKHIIAGLLLLLASAVSGEEAKVPHVILQTSFGPIEIELNPAKAPESVETFLTYVKEGFYEGTIFHRVINNFVVQGGGYTADFKKKDTHPSIPNEAANGLKNLRGTVALARSNDPHSANSQFFVNVRDNKFLDYKSSTAAGWGYCVFGKVVEGMEVIDKIAKVPTDSGGPFKRDVPQTTITIDAVKVEYVAPTDWITTSAGGSDKPAAEKKPAASSEEKKKSDSSMADMQQDMLSMDVEEDEKSPAEKDKSKSVSSADKPAGKKPVPEKSEKTKAVADDDDTQEQDMSSKDTAAEDDSEPAITPGNKKIPAGDDKQSSETKEAKVAKESKAHHEVKAGLKPVPESEKPEKAKTAAMQEEGDMSSKKDAEDDSESATASDNQKNIPGAGTSQKSAADAKGKESLTHNEAKTNLKPVTGKSEKSKTAATEGTQEEDDISSAKDAEGDDDESATASDNKNQKKVPGGAGTNQKSSGTKTGKEPKATIEEKQLPTVTKAVEEETSEQAARQEDATPDSVLKTEHSAKTAHDESSPKKDLKLKEDSSATSKREKEAPTATTPTSQNQPSIKDESEKKAVASIEERTENKTMVKPGEKVSAGKTTPPPDKPTPPDKPEPVAY